jgi:hypothetical protein
VSPPPTFVRTPAALQAYRDHELTPENVSVRLKTARGPVAFTGDAGLGKTTVIDGLVARHRQQPDNIVLIYLTSQRSVIHERPWVREYLALPMAERAAHDVAVLEGRPRARCGPLNDRWVAYEAAGCAPLGRIELCGGCPQRGRCAWPEQRTADALAGKRVIAATQTNLAVTPRLISELKAKAKADRVLVILDETTLLETQFRRRITHDAMRISRAVFARVSAPTAWIDAHDALLDPAFDLADFESPGMLPPEVATAVQRAGLASGRGFRFLAHDLAALASGAPARNSSGVEYLARPWLQGHPCLILAAGLPIELARHRLGTPHIEEFSPGLRFLHEGTEVFNIASSVGTAQHFLTHRPQILFAYAQLIARLAAEGKRALVVVKKSFAEVCGAELQAYLRELGWREARVVRDPTTEQVADPDVVPLITYGMRGLNRYEHFDAAFALCGYHIPPDVIEQYLNDVYGPDDQVRVEFVQTDGKRVAAATDYGQQLRGFGALARDYQHQHETAIAEQALGRVRFAVRPRLVVFFQRGPLRYPLTRDFPTLEAFRRHFGLMTRREWKKAGLAARVAALTAAGATVAGIATELGLTERQVYRVRAASRQGAP